MVTGPADDQRFAPACRHKPGPQGPLGLSFPSQVLERSHVVDLAVLPRAAQRTGVRQEPSFACGPWHLDGEGEGQGGIIADRRRAPRPGDPAPRGDEGRALVSAFNDDLEAHTRTLVRREGGPLAVVDLIDAEAQPVRQRPGRRPFHAPLQVVELVAVAGPLVGGHDAPLLLLVLRPDAVSRIVAQVRAVDRFAVLALAGALIAPHVPWHVQPDRASEAALAALIVLVVVVADHDLVAEGARGLRARVGDQGLTLGEFQLEVLAQGASDLPFALFSFVPWSADAEQPTIGIAHVPQAPVAWITGVLRATGHLLPLPTPLAGLVALPWCAQVTDPVLQT